MQGDALLVMTWSYCFCCHITTTAASEAAKQASRKKKRYSVNEKTSDLTHLLSKHSFRQKITVGYTRSVLTQSSRGKYCTILQQEYCNVKKRVSSLKFSLFLKMLGTNKGNYSPCCSRETGYPLQSRENLAITLVKNYIGLLVVLLIRSTAFLHTF